MLQGSWLRQEVNHLSFQKSLKRVAIAGPLRKVHWKHCSEPQRCENGCVACRTACRPGGALQARSLRAITHTGMACDAAVSVISAPLVTPRDSLAFQAGFGSVCILLYPYLRQTSVTLPQEQCHTKREAELTPSAKEAHTGANWPLRMPQEPLSCETWCHRHTRGSGERHPYLHCQQGAGPQPQPERSGKGKQGPSHPPHEPRKGTEAQARMAGQQPTLTLQALLSIR